MVIDTSALLTLLLAQPGAELVARALEDAKLRLLSAASLLEAAIEIEQRKGEAGGRELDLLLYRAGIEIVDVDANQAEIARDAWRRFGRRADNAGLDYGDCFAYALARCRGLPLLFVDDNLARTDLAIVAVK